MSQTQAAFSISGVCIRKLGQALLPIVCCEVNTAQVGLALNWKSQLMCKWLARRQICLGFLLFSRLDYAVTVRTYCHALLLLAVVIPEERPFGPAVGAVVFAERAPVGFPWATDDVAVYWPHSADIPERDDWDRHGICARATSVFLRIVPRPLG